MIKIAYDYQIFEWQKYGGVSRYIYEIASHLSKEKEVTVEILAFAHINEYIKNDNSGLIRGFVVPNIKRTGKIKRSFNANLSKAVLRHNPPDIIHKTYYQPHRLAPKSTKEVITIHDMTHEIFRQYFPDLKDSKNKAASVKQADHIICVSENTKKDLITIFDTNPNKISVVHLGSSLTPSQDRSTKLEATDPYILFVGERGRYKNFEQLLRAYASSSQLKRDFKLICFGRNPFSLTELNLLDKLGLFENQVLQVSGNDDVLTRYYQSASVLVYPSLYEGFGIPLIEAMSLHCPVACSNVSSLPEVAGDAAQLFDPYNPESITEALEKVLYSSHRSTELVALGIERAKKFTWKACAEQTQAVYQSLL